MSETQSSPLQNTVRWLVQHVGFPRTRLPEAAERLLLLATAAAADEIASADGAGNRPNFMVQSKDSAMESALRQHAERRKRVHFKCDNSAKV